MKKPSFRPTPNDREIVMREDDFIVSRTDARGVITYANRIFIEFSRYSEDELLDAPHNIIRHPDMPKAVFRLLWKTISDGREIFAYVKNLAKTGEHYWVYANVTPDFDEAGRIVGYTSVRRKPKESAIRTIEPIYATLLRTEQARGAEASFRELETLLNKEGVDYDAFVRNL